MSIAVRVCREIYRFTVYDFVSSSVTRGCVAGDLEVASNLPVV